MSQRSQRSEGDSVSGERPVARILTSVPSPAPLPAPDQPYEPIPVPVDAVPHSGLTGRHAQKDIAPEAIMLPGQAGRPTTLNQIDANLQAGMGRTEAVFDAEQKYPSNHIPVPSLGPVPEEVKQQKLAARRTQRNAAALGVLLLVFAAASLVAYLLTHH